MSSKVYYFFCDTCGGDTAMYEPHDICPYCHAEPPQFRVIAESDSNNSRVSIVSTLELLRAKWISDHKLAATPRKSGKPAKK